MKRWRRQGTKRRGPLNVNFYAHDVSWSHVAAIGLSFQVTVALLKRLLSWRASATAKGISFDGVLDRFFSVPSKEHVQIIRKCRWVKDWV